MWLFSRILFPPSSWWKLTTNSLLRRFIKTNASFKCWSGTTYYDASSRRNGVVPWKAGGSETPGANRPKWAGPALVALCVCAERMVSFEMFSRILFSPSSWWKLTKDQKHTFVRKEWTRNKKMNPICCSLYTVVHTVGPSGAVAVVVAVAVDTVRRTQRIQKKWDLHGKNQCWPMMFEMCSM